MWMVHTATWDHGVIQAQADAKGHVWVHGTSGDVVIPVTTKGHVDAWGLGHP